MSDITGPDKENPAAKSPYVTGEKPLPAQDNRPKMQRPANACADGHGAIYPIARTLENGKYRIQCGRCGKRIDAPTIAEAVELWNEGRRGEKHLDEVGK